MSWEVNVSPDERGTDRSGAFIERFRLTAIDRSSLAPRVIHRRKLTAAEVENYDPEVEGAADTECHNDKEKSKP